jgi:hypothetical protein
MVKLVSALHRLPSLSREELQRYWLGTHGPLVRSHAETLGIRFIDHARSPLWLADEHPVVVGDVG